MSVDDNDLLLIDKYLNTIRDVVKSNRGGLERVEVTWRYLPDGSTLPELYIWFRSAPDAEPVEGA